MAGLEKQLGIAASIITIFGFVLAVSRIAELGALEFASPENISPAFGSWLLVIVFCFLFAVFFGIGFASLVVWLENVLGRISLAVATPVVGMISGFQSGSVTLILAVIFDIKAGLGLLIFVTLVFSCIIETVFIYRGCDKNFGIGVIELFDGPMPARSVGMSSVNAAFFTIGAYLLMVDAALLATAAMMFWIFIVFLIFGVVSFLAGSVLFLLLEDD